MKLYYDPNRDELLESGIARGTLFTRDLNGHVTVPKSITNLVLIGDIYNKPIELDGEFRMYKVVNGNAKFIISGTNPDNKIEEGLRFNVDGRGFNYYSTNIITAINRISGVMIEFYTMSGSSYILELEWTI